LKAGYTALFDLEADPETLRLLPFEKAIAPTRAPKNDIRTRVRAWQQRQAFEKMHHSPILRRLDDDQMACVG
ncbi:MAG TPA: hypothetical protein VFQ54_13340, partial [Thermomicrobiales bacterium]|nr:hypothetical protein [Thermomicrobiales bacterium]